MARIDAIEKYRPLPTREKFSKDIAIVTDVASARGIAVVRGRKFAEAQELAHQLIIHLVWIENGVKYCSHREEEGAEVTYGTADKLLGDRWNELGIFYHLLVNVK